MAKMIEGRSCQIIIITIKNLVKETRGESVNKLPPSILNYCAFFLSAGLFKDWELRMILMCATVNWGIMGRVIQGV